MKVKSPKVKKLLEKYKNISLLSKVASVLGWDMNVNLPPKGAEGRSSQLAYLAKLITEMWQDPEFKRIIGESDESDTSLTIEEKAVIRNLKESSKYYYKVPKEIIVEFSETSSKSFMAWQKAKAENKFADFEPHLTKMVRLNRVVSEHLGYKKNPYDALLDLFEPGLTHEFFSGIFSAIQPKLTGLLKRIKGSRGYSDKSELVGDHMYYPIDDQRQLAMFALKKIGYDLDAGRMDVSSHPFTDTLDHHDVRITNRYTTGEFRESLMVAMHEGGHALYEQGVREDYSGSPLDGGVSLGIHESQSRFWENQVGRSFEFIKFMTPLFHAFYPEQLGKVGAEELYRLFNQVHPSLIRTEADEVTYNLHIGLRFEIENGLINGKMEVKDLPEIWRAKMKKYLGIEPKTDREGVLQDIHWSHGPMGYFPTYTLGNLYAAQFTNKLQSEVELQSYIEKGELGTILSWLRTNIHQYGSLYYSEDLCRKVTGEKLNPKYFLRYVKDKYTKIYNLTHK